jgi:HEAT repeat protein
MKHRITIVMLIVTALVCFLFAGCAGMAMQKNIKALQDEDAGVRKEAAIALGEKGDQKAVEPLIEAMSDQDASVRVEVAIALGNSSDERTIKPLVDALNDKDDNVKESVVNALVKTGEPAIESLVAVLNDNESSCRTKSAEVLGKIGDKRAIEPLIAVLKDEDNTLRVEAAIALGNIGKPAIESLIAELNNQDSDKRVQAAEVLGKIGDESAIEPLIASLKEDDSALRAKAAECLGQFDDERAIDPLSFVALNDKDSKVKKCAKLALLDLNNHKAVDVYISMLNSGSSGMKFQAAKILSNLDDPKAEKVKSKAEKVIKQGAYIIDKSSCNVYGDPTNSILKNTYEEDIAKLERKGKTDTIFDLSTGQEIISWAIGKRDEIGPSYICLDEEGNIIRDENGKPVLVEDVPAKQKSVASVHYGFSNPFIPSGATIKIYPCENCAEETGIENCSYIWFASF